MAMKYCLNSGNLSGTTYKGGIFGGFNNFVGTNGYDGLPDSNPIRGGKSDIEVTYNYNTGDISVIDNVIGGIVAWFNNNAYSSSCYLDVIFSNNFNTGSATDSYVRYYIAGIIGYSTAINNTVIADNFRVVIKNCYSYSVDLTKGNADMRAGVLGQFTGDCSNVTLLNNYSAYKRETDNNIYGTNTNGANVGE